MNKIWIAACLAVPASVSAAVSGGVSSTYSGYSEDGLPHQRLVRTQGAVEPRVTYAQRKAPTVTYIAAKDSSTYDLAMANLSPPETTANPHPPRPDTAETELAVLRDCTVIGRVLEKAGTLWNEHKAEPTPGFKPYHYVAYHENRYHDVLGFIRKNGVGDVHSKAQLDARVAGWRRDLQDRETIARGTSPYR